MATYLSVSEYKTYKGITNNDDDALIDSLIDSAQLWLDKAAKRTLYASSDTTRYFDSYDDADGRVLYIDDDLCSITSVTIDGTSLASTEYTTNPRNETPYYELIMKRNSDYSWTDDNDSGDYDAEDAIAITGKWSYFSSVTDDLQQAMKRLTDYLYTQKDAGAFDVTAIPAAGVIEVPQGFPVDVMKWVKTVQRI